MKNLILKACLLILPWTQGLTPKLLAQDSLPENKTYFSIGSSLGRIVPNYLNNYPSSSLRSDVILSVVWKNTKKSWSKYYNTPEVGISSLFSILGNENVFGNQISIYPFVRFRQKNKEKPWHIQYSIGASYFDKPYDSITNIENLAIGSHFTWHFSASLYKTLKIFEKSELRLSGNFIHASNGHIQIPNFGLNSGTIGLELLINSSSQYKDKSTSKDKPIWMIEQMNSIGIHELAGTYRPIGGEKYHVRSHGLNAAYLHNGHFKIKAGFTYRYYDSYYKYMNKTRTSVNVMDASNVYFMAGTEFLFGHIGIDIEGGLNLYKPFYEEYYFTFDNKGKVDYWSKKLFNTRMGLNYYLIDNTKTPTFNVKVGAHINANFGTADFSSLSLGFVYNLK